MDPTPTAADWLSAGATTLAALAALAASLVAILTLRQMKADSKSQKQDSEQATRPYVHARLVPSVAGLDAWDLVVRNSGRTPAFNLRLDIRADGAPDDKITQAVCRFAAAGQTLQPDTSIRTYWSVDATKDDAMGFPRATVEVRYEGPGNIPYEEPAIILDPNDMGLTPVPSTGPKATSGKFRIGRDSVHALRAIARHVGELNR
ncbi:hypothetical protein ACTXKN_04380 [Brachybacterium alimentarium]|uniref:hypothetical protein n=1 Tax=Brachybacterium alimentarium TaxID=47845 RepID=UPI003FCFAC29